MIWSRCLLDWRWSRFGRGRRMRRLKTAMTGEILFMRRAGQAKPSNCRSRLKSLAKPAMENSEWAAMTDERPITVFLQAWSAGDESALAKLVPQVQREL